jgi:hypothetical protein
MERDIIRRCIFRPYRRGQGPTFRLTMWDTHRADSMGKWVIGYELKEGRDVLFAGEDFRCSPLHSIDSDDAVQGIMGFLTLRPGDTDAEYFDAYTEEQLAYCTHHAEALGLAVLNRFGE